MKTRATSTSVLFMWGKLVNDFSIEISLHNISQMVKHEVFFEWTDLRPATLHTFTLNFRQLHLEFLNVSQTLEVQIETGMHSNCL